MAKHNLLRHIAQVSSTRSTRLWDPCLKVLGFFNAGCLRKLCDRKNLPIIPYLLSIHLNVGHIVFKHSWDIDFWELVFAKDDEETGFTTSTISYDYQLLSNGCHFSADSEKIILKFRYSILWYFVSGTYQLVSTFSNVWT